jgi:hypothetical protein
MGGKQRLLASLPHMLEEAKKKEEDYEETD